MWKKIEENLWEVYVSSNFSFSSRYRFTTGDIIYISSVKDSADTVSKKAFIIGKSYKYPQLVGRSFCTSLIKNRLEIIESIESSTKQKTIDTWSETKKLVKTQLVKVKKRKLLLTINKF